MTIPKNTNRAKWAIANAREVKCFSLSNNFSGEPLAERPVVWGGEVINNRHTKLIEVSQAQFLMREVNLRHAKLTGSDTFDADNYYTLHVHDNLWYTFRA